ncbi:MAG: Crp/Fnr family transcriptional regulator [bacterium]|nr:Crp/Fnr family transcriptional regulator [bacterium]
MENEVVEKLNQFFSQGKTVSYKKGEIILRAGEPVFGIFFLKKGFVRQYLISEEGEEVTIHLYRPLAFFPTMLVIAGTPNRYYFEAQTPIETFRLPPEEVVAFLKENPDVLFDLSERFAQAVIGLSKRIETLSIGSVYAKVISLLSYLVIRFGEEKDGQILIGLPVTHTDIASWTGAKRETVSRQIERLTKDGIIGVEKHLIVVKDKAKLEEELKHYHESESL